MSPNINGITCQKADPRAGIAFITPTYKSIIFSLIPELTSDVTDFLQNVLFARFLCEKTKQRKCEIGTLNSLKEVFKSRI